MLVVSEDIVTIAVASAGSLGTVGLVAAFSLLIFRYRKNRERKELDVQNSLEGSTSTIVPPKRFQALRDWYSWNKSQIRFWVCYCLAIIGFGLWGYLENMHITSPPYLAYAKVFGKILDFLLTIIILPILRNMLSWLRTTPAAGNSTPNLCIELLPLDENIKIHSYTGYLIMVCGMGHIGFHYADFWWLENIKARMSM